MKKILSLTYIPALIFLLLPSLTQATTDVGGNISNVVYIECGSFVGDQWNPQVSGSGVIVDTDAILTNAHVVVDDQRNYFEYCFGGYSTSSYTAPTLDFMLIPEEFSRYDDYFDYVFMDAYDFDGNAMSFPGYATLANADSMTLNEEINVIGYPAIAGSTVTVTSGNIAGFEGGNWIKTDAVIEHGNSGGGAFDVAGNLFGIPTMVSAGSLNSIGYIQNINAILEDAFGTDAVVRDISTLYQSNNIFCVLGDCYNFATDENTWGDTASSGSAPTVEAAPEPEAVISHDTGSTYSLPPSTSYIAERRDDVMIDRLKGNILLQVEENGEAWYLHPIEKIRYYLKDGAVAYQMMRTFGLGITDSNLASIPAVANSNEMLSVKSICDTNALARSLRGRILLQVEQHGEAWYVHPDKCYRIYMKDGEAAYDIMRYLSLGITNENLSRLPYADSLEIK